MLLKLIPAIAVALGFGFGIGCIPGLNEHLHWNLWFVIPISGLIFGVLTAFVQFGVGYVINLNIKGTALLVLILAAVSSYIAVEYGIYYTTKIPVQGVEGVPDGTYRLSEITSFKDYMKLSLGSSSIRTRYGDNTYEMGATGTTISYVLDLIGVFLGAAAVLLVLGQKYPFCLLCAKYKKREQKFNILLSSYVEDTINEIFSTINTLIGKTEYRAIVGYVRELSKTHADSKGDFKIVVDQRYCPDCREATLLGSVYQKVDSQWKEIDDLSFSFTSEAGQHVSLA